MNKIKLYIVKQNEKISDIALKFNTTVEEIIRYNPSLRYKRIYKGQPLNIVVKQEEISSESKLTPVENRNDDSHYSCQVRKVHL